MTTVLREVDVDQDLWFRICGEYLEMPGLVLTVRQASRLWNADAASTQRVLDGLVEAAFLDCRDGRYVRADAACTPF